MPFGLMRRSRPEEPSGARVPDGIRVYAVGDVHGRDDLLRAMLGLVTADAAAAPGYADYLVFLGDYVDRGLESRAVVERLTGPPPSGFGFIHLKGNHEAAMLDFLDDVSVGPSWFAFGGLATLHSYGVGLDEATPSEERLLRAQAGLRRALPPRHRAFLAHLRPSLTIGDYFFVHAGVRPGVPLDRQVERDTLWIREPFLSSRLDHGKIVVHGHTITEAPEVRRNRIGVDTGAYASGHLTCLVLEGERRRFLVT